MCAPGVHHGSTPPAGSVSVRATTSPAADSLRASTRSSSDSRNTVAIADVPLPSEESPWWSPVTACDSTDMGHRRPMGAGQPKLFAPASATVWSFSTVLPLTPMAPTTLPAPSRSGIPPGKVMRPPFDTSMLNSGPPGCERAPMSPEGMSKYRAVRAFRMAMSMLPSQAPSMRWNVLRFPPASTTATFIKVSISSALRMALSRTLRASGLLMSAMGHLSRIGSNKVSPRSGRSDRHGILVVQDELLLIDHRVEEDRDDHDPDRGEDSRRPAAGRVPQYPADDRTRDGADLGDQVEQAE